MAVQERQPAASLGRGIKQALLSRTTWSLIILDGTVIPPRPFQPRRSRLQEDPEAAGTNLAGSHFPQVGRVPLKPWRLPHSRFV